MLGNRNLYIIDVPQTNDIAYRLVNQLMGDKFNYTCYDDEREDIDAFLASKRNYLCDDCNAANVAIYNWKEHVEPSIHHVIMTYNEFIKKYLGIDVDKLNYEVFSQLETKIASDDKCLTYTMTLKGNKYTTALFDRYIEIVSEFFGKKFTKKQCKAIKIAQEVIKLPEC